MSTSTNIPRFRARCPACGPVELAATQLRLVVAARSFYSFRCPRCRQNVRRPAGDRIIELLTDSGVFAVRVHAS